MYIYASGMPAALAAAFSWSVVASVQADAAVGTGVTAGTVGVGAGDRPGMGTGAAVGQVLQVTGQAAEISAFVQPYPYAFSLGIVSPQVVMKLAYKSGTPAALAAAFS